MLVAVSWAVDGLEENWKGWKISSGGFVTYEWFRTRETNKGEREEAHSRHKGYVVVVVSRELTIEVRRLEKG